MLTLADGQVLRGADTCMALRTRQPLHLDPAAMAVPMNKYQELLAAVAKISPVHPASNPPTWYRQLDRDALYGIYTGTPPKADARPSEGGFYPNLDNQYIRAILNRKLGKVFVVRGKAPMTPKTIQGDAKMGSGELRYWSFCSNQGFANTRVNECVHDENVPVGPDGYYTIVVSRAADRPRNAIVPCGIAWLPMAALAMLLHPIDGFSKGGFSFGKDRERTACMDDFHRYCPGQTIGHKRDVRLPRPDADPTSADA